MQMMRSMSETVFEFENSNPKKIVHGCSVAARRFEIYVCCRLQCQRRHCRRKTRCQKLWFNDCCSPSNSFTFDGLITAQPQQLSIQVLTSKISFLRFHIFVY